MYGFQHATAPQYFLQFNRTTGELFAWTDDPGAATTYETPQKAIEAIMDYAIKWRHSLFVIRPVKITEIPPKPAKPEYAVEALS